MGAAESYAKRACNDAVYVLRRYSFILHVMRGLIPPLVLSLALVGIFIWSFHASAPLEEAASALPTANVTVAASAITAEIASDPADRERGLSGRDALAAGHGMLFVFPESQPYGFWMPDMHFAIDIIWIDESKHIIYIAPNATPESYPHIFAPPVPARYVLEVPKGEAAKNGWGIGDPVDWQEIVRRP